MAVTAGMVKELRELTGAGMMDCKKALTETDGDMDAAVEYLRKNGQAKAEKKAPVKKAASKKAELKTEMFLQFAGKEYTDKEIFDKIKYVWSKVLKNKVGDMKDVKIYLKPEESAAYYVINGDTTGKVDL